MRIHLLAVGTRLPDWINRGFEDYAARMPPESRLLLREIPLGTSRRGGDTLKAIAEEGARMNAAIPEHTHVVALEVNGRSLSTQELAEQFKRWLQDGRDLALLVGGPDGLAPACVERAETRWSLSPLTLPHGLVRILVAEQLYRASSILKNHPYHRA